MNLQDLWFLCKSAEVRYDVPVDGKDEMSDGFGLALVRLHLNVSLDSVSPEQSVLRSLGWSAIGEARILKAKRTLTYCDRGPRIRRLVMQNLVFVVKDYRLAVRQIDPFLPLARATDQLVLALQRST